MGLLQRHKAESKDTAMITGVILLDRQKNRYFAL